MKQQPKTEEDTYLTLKRIPFPEVGVRLGVRQNMLWRNEQLKRNIEILENKWYTKFLKKRKERIFVLKTNLLSTKPIEPSIIEELKGTGWDLESFIGEIRKEILENDLQQKKKAIKMNSGFLALILILPALCYILGSLMGAYYFLTMVSLTGIISFFGIKYLTSLK
jgi:hypothetical protein